LPATDQVFLVPVDSRVEAAQGTVIRTDGPNGPVELYAVTLPYDGVLVSRGYFLLLIRMAEENVPKP